MAELTVDKKTGKKRFPEYDIAKGIGVILVVIGHMGRLPFPLLVWIFSFHIPMYFFISGIFVKKENTEPLSRSIVKNIKGLLIPYCVFSCIFILADLILRDGITSPRLEVRLFLTGQGGYAILWFFFVLFFERLLLDILKRLVKNRLALSLIILCLVALGFFLRHRFLFNEFKISTILYASGFYYLGFLLQDSGRFHTLTSREKWYLFPVFLALNILGCYALVRLNGTTLDLNSATCYDIVLNYATAFCGICFTLILSRLLVPNILGRVFSYIGRNSLFFYPLLGYIPFKVECVTGIHTDWIKIISYTAAALISIAAAEIARRRKASRAA